MASIYTLSLILFYGRGFSKEIRVRILKYIIRLYKSCSDMVYCILRTGSWSKDCIHDVFVKIYTNRAKLTPTDNIIAYLMVALKNTLFNALKKTSDSFSLDEADEKEDQSEEHFSTPETIYINKEQEKNTHMKVHAMMSSLTTRQREIVYYRYIKDMSIDEISKITDMNYQSVSNSIQRALGRVRNLFKRE